MIRFIVQRALTVIATVALCSGYAFALPSGTALQQSFDKRTEGGVSSINVSTNMISDKSDSYWTVTSSRTSAATLMFEFTTKANTNSFGIFDRSNPSVRLELFSGLDSAGNPSSQTAVSYWEPTGEYYITNDYLNTAVPFGSSTYGYYLTDEEEQETVFSDSSLNGNGLDHLFAYQGTNNDNFSVAGDGDYRLWTNNEYILAWEQLLSDGNQEFTDFVVMVESVEPVPEPATLLLFGAGIVGIIGYRRMKNV